MTCDNTFRVETLMYYMHVCSLIRVWKTSKKYIDKFCTIGDANTKQVAESIFINLSMNEKIV